MCRFSGFVSKSETCDIGEFRVVPDETHNVFPPVWDVSERPEDKRREGLYDQVTGTPIRNIEWNRRGLRLVFGKRWDLRIIPHVISKSERRDPFNIARRSILPEGTSASEYNVN
jgi:hypothetical protein